jgi:ATP-dependent RNA helicase DDX3X
MFSATFPASARALARKYLDEDHVRFRVGRIGATTSTVTQNIIYVDRNEKQRACYDLLIVSPPTRTIIFVNSKHTVDKLDDYLYNLHLPTTSVHSDRTQHEREDSL